MVIPNLPALRAIRAKNINSSKMSGEVFVKIPVEDKELDGVVSIPKQTSWQGFAVVLSHGAGGDMHHEQLTTLANHLSQAGLMCLRFTVKSPNFKYRIKCFVSVLEFLKHSEQFNVNSCIIGGRSMSARAAAEVASALDNHARNFTIGLLCLSYPLHSPHVTSVLRTTSLTSVRIPSLFVSGTRDIQCRVDLMEKTLKCLSCDWSIHWVQGGDHRLVVKGKSGRDTKEILDGVCDCVLSWAQSVFMGER